MSPQSLKGFDRLAPVYDRFARLVYGSAIRDAQLFFLSTIPPTANVLILGGGTGWLLNDLFKTRPECRVCYVEASAKMLALAQQQLPAQKKGQVHFILGTEDAIPTVRPFDAVITAFYLDLFSPDTLRCIIDKVSASLTSSGIWLVSDFTTPKTWWQKALLKIMYIFFRRVCGIEATHLPAWDQALVGCGWHATGEKLFFHGFIKSVTYRFREKE